MVVSVTFRQGVMLINPPAELRMPRYLDLDLDPPLSRFNPRPGLNKGNAKLKRSKRYIVRRLMSSPLLRHYK